MNLILSDCLLGKQRIIVRIGRVCYRKESMAIFMQSKDGILVTKFGRTDEAFFGGKGERSQTHGDIDCGMLIDGHWKSYMSHLFFWGKTIR